MAANAIARSHVPALKLSIGGQYTNDILPSSEEFYLGGTRFGRGFYNGEVVGDRAIGSTVEFQENDKLDHLPFINPDYVIPAQFYQFLDYGRGYDLAPMSQSFTIVSTGLGVRADLNEWMFMEIEGVHRLTTHPEGPAVPTEAEYAFYTRVTLHY